MVFVFTFVIILLLSGDKCAGNAGRRGVFLIDEIVESYVGGRIVRGRFSSFISVAKIPVMATHSFS